MVYAVIYWRRMAQVEDHREFTTLEELSDWFTRQNELEPTVIREIRPISGRYPWGKEPASK